MGRFIIGDKNAAVSFIKKSEAPVEPAFRFYGRFLMGFGKMGVLDVVF
jgi:hypothetical protein